VTAKRGVLVTATVVCLLTVSFGLQARGEFDSCGTGLQIPVKPAFDGDLSGEVIQITADDADLSEEGVSLLRGNVQYNKGELRLVGERMRYDKPSEIMTGKGDLKLWDKGVHVTGREAELNTVTGAWDLRYGTYIFAEKHAHGSAQRFSVSETDIIQAQEATYTTCNPGDDIWVLEANHIELNQLTDVGTARDVKLLIKGTPVFYSPWLSFPLSTERKSGLLAPSFGTLGSTGFESTIPYYFNIAPNLDATVAARVMSERGLMGTGEVRYLSSRRESELNVEVLPHDIVDAEPRGAVSLKHSGAVAPKWRAYVDYNWVSDSQYFEDFGNSLSASSTTFLTQSASALYDDGWWHFAGRVHNFQTVNPNIPGASRPYRRLPQLSLSYLPGERNRQLYYGGFVEAVYFDNSSRINGLRLDAEPFVSFPMRTAGSFFVPKAKLKYTQYYLDNTAGGASENPSRLVPSLSVDSGLLFERTAELGGTSFIQTLEPRMYYLYSAYNNQDDLPIFDTGRYTFNFAQLFRDRRFAGSDRVGDDHHVSLAVTSRVLSPQTGAELFRASIGQIVYLRDRRIQLPGVAIEDDFTSDLVAEVSATIANDWTVNAGTIWDPHANRTERATVGLRYQPAPDTVVNASYRFVRGTAETSDISFRWPVLPDVGVVGRWNYALAKARTLEAFAGVEFDSCCWSFRAVARRHLADVNGEYNDSLFLQLELKGLAGVGRSTERFLERYIPGYQNPF
jgi:LPS-assembly protein